MILLLSGGLDSIAAWRLLGLPDAVSFGMSTKAEHRETDALNWAKFKFGAEYATRYMPMVGEQGNGYVPYRNSLLILAAAQLDRQVIIGAIAEWAPDKNRRFYRRLERTVNVTGKVAKFSGPLRIYDPYAGYAKGRLIAEYAKRFGLGEAAELLKNTWSCYGDGYRHCGRCGGCIQRWNAEAYYAALVGLPLNDALSVYDAEPPLGLTPIADKARWVRDNGWLGVQQLTERRRQNRSALQLHGALASHSESSRLRG